MPHALAHSNRTHLSFNNTHPEAQTINIVIVGLGGQGSVKAGDVLALLAAEAGNQVSTLSSHGMAQRGETVTTFVRFGPQAASSYIDLGQADYILALEITEAQRALPYLKEDGLLISNDYEEAPISVFVGNDHMPKKPRKILKDAGHTVINASDQAMLAHNTHAVNVVMLGALATQLSFSDAEWQSALERTFPESAWETNWAAFERGRMVIQRNLK